MESDTLLSLLLGDSIRFVAVKQDDVSIELHIESISPASCCPDCGFRSSRIHSHYVRKLRDLPILGCRAIIHYNLRRFRCSNTTCPRQVFCERIDLAPSRQRETTRFLISVQNLGLALGGNAAARLGAWLGIPVSSSSILRILRRRLRSGVETMESQFIGIDDWAIRKGHRYGTLICDLERHRPIAVLPDRKSETISAWLKQHANVSLVSRDRGGEYSRGISEGNPNCQQVADRWHLIHNAWQWMTKEVLRCMPELRQTERIQPATPCSNTEAVDNETVETTSSPRFENHLSDNAVIYGANDSHIAEDDSKNLGIAQAQRKESILALAAQGHSIGQISRKLELTRNTVRAYLRGTHRGRAQGTQTDTQRKSLIDSYLTKLESMAADKTNNAMDIYRAMFELGYCGGIHTVRRTLAKCRKNLEKGELNRPSPRKQLNAYQFCRTLLKNSHECDENELKLRNTIQKQIPSLERTARTLRDFI